MPQPYSYSTANSEEPLRLRRLGCGASRYAAFLFLNERRALAETLPQISQLGAADGAFALHFHLLHARRMDGENPLHAFAVADAAHGEHLVQPMTATANHHASENLYALLLALDHFGVHTHGIAHAEVHGDLAILFRLNFV